jgi:hypothetical protein
MVTIIIQTDFVVQILDERCQFQRILFLFLHGIETAKTAGASS